MLDGLVLLLLSGEAALLVLLFGLDCASSRLGTLRMVEDRSNVVLEPMCPQRRVRLIEPIETGRSVLNPGSSSLGGSEGTLRSGGHRIVSIARPQSKHICLPWLFHSPAH